MGLFSALFHPKKLPMLVVTLDALGTVYNFRQPVSVQYLQVAESCGLKAKVDLKQLDRSFRSSFKHYNAAHPNYGKKTLGSPEEWWTKVVNRAFGDLVEGGEAMLPKDLGSALYKHFSSSAAYEPFPDVKPFLQSMAALKKQYADPEGPLVATGIVTNSDPRVRVVLQDMGFHVGPSSIPDFESIMKTHMDSLRDPSKVVFNSPVRDYYNPQNDFDFLCTSYDADAEKPDEKIWLEALRLVFPMPISRSEQKSEPASSITEAFRKVSSALNHQSDISRMLRIHIGDEYSKDYVGAVGAGWEALHLDREGSSSGLGSDAKVVQSLDEAAMVVNLMARDYFRQNED
ncbi:uncharacterized protein Z520_07354 [Fonsecaea multimorphosa CBS 102226]|uniref:Haloacid dehalogenase-like hydrolase n=1 Tax=Fonsecaea multimorphosa CBS 102226 TaxID=1442371 RepID=A0A0D2K2E8_9EURO|nr:uncharacterized protein Z520_07354 [Fonsecaea multimorphosa CBS 102226]KIX97239.1 hypothetical protein Z520_07354 [Fonsecaea multimorphosa CBS 102226]OAL23010.1 hypothetical protein AYO22_06918 [Fonsecaea multimorphosa]